MRGLLSSRARSAVPALRPPRPLCGLHQPGLPQPSAVSHLQRAYCEHPEGAAIGVSASAALCELETSAESLTAHSQCFDSWLDTSGLIGLDALALPAQVKQLLPIRPVEVS